MLQCGLPVPVEEESTAGIFKDIFVDIGDQQSLENDLSTYSSHLQNMTVFLNNASTNSLVLVDEFGTGTEPRFGSAIAEGILRQLVRSGTSGVITTHYSALKDLAENEDGIINAAMLFDLERLQLERDLRLQSICLRFEPHVDVVADRAHRQRRGNATASQQACKDKAADS